MSEECSSSVSSEEDDIYEVDKIIGISQQGGKEVYKVRWKGYAPSYDTWEPRENLLTCVDMIDQYKIFLEHEDKKDEAHEKKKEENEKKKKDDLKKTSAEPEAVQDESHKASVNLDTTVKDTFWDDLKDGKIDVFASGDMYSKLKTGGRAARPVSFTEMYSDSPARKRNDDSETDSPPSKVSKLLHKDQHGAAMKKTKIITKKKSEDDKPEKLKSDSLAGEKDLDLGTEGKALIKSSEEAGVEFKSEKVKLYKSDKSKADKAKDKTESHHKTHHEKKHGVKKSDVDESMALNDKTKKKKEREKEQVKKHESKPQNTSESNKSVAPKASETKKKVGDDITMEVKESSITNEHLKQAVKVGDYQLISKALHQSNTSVQLDIEQPDVTGMTFAMMAANNGSEDILELLMLFGANINKQQKSGNSALMYAADHGHVCSVAVIVDQGGHLNLQNSSGETALIKAVKRGCCDIIKLLLENGANFACQTCTGNTALKFAKMLNNLEIQEMINTHIARLNTVFDKQIQITLNNTANIICPLFPIQCLSLAEGEKFIINFNHDLEPPKQGVGFLLFIAHARVTAQEVRCRFYGLCAVMSTVLNTVPQPALTEEGNFVMSFSPLHEGLNELEIHTEAAPQSKAKLVVCAYKAQLEAPKQS